MNITRERFVDHFAITIDVHSLRMWSKREKEPPMFLSRSIYEAICVNNGEISVPEQAFYAVIKPAIVELHGKTPRGTRPDREVFAGAVYDALDRAGVEVKIGPPIKAHGHAFGRSGRY